MPHTIHLFTARFFVLLYPFMKWSHSILSYRIALSPFGQLPYLVDRVNNVTLGQVSIIMTLTLSHYGYDFDHRRRCLFPLRYLLLSVAWIECGDFCVCQSTDSYRWWRQSSGKIQLHQFHTCLLAFFLSSDGYFMNWLAWYVDLREYAAIHRARSWTISNDW